MRIYTLSTSIALYLTLHHSYTTQEKATQEKATLIISNQKWSISALSVTGLDHGDIIYNNTIYSAQTHLEFVLGA